MKYSRLKLIIVFIKKKYILIHLKNLCYSTKKIYLVMTYTSLITYLKNLNNIYKIIKR